jgi:hypothetical protein
MYKPWPCHLSRSRRRPHHLAARGPQAHGSANAELADRTHGASIHRVIHSRVILAARLMRATGCDAACAWCPNGG